MSACALTGTQNAEALHPYSHACDVVQGVTILAMFTAAKLHAHPLERAWLLLPFFLGAAEIASGVSGL